MKKTITVLFFSVFSISVFSQEFPDIDTLNFDRVPRAALDSQFFKFIPSVDYTQITGYSGDTRFTTDFEPSNSSWCSQCEEDDVYLARMSHFLNADTLWDLRIGLGGQIYSFIGPYGEGVPPSIHPGSDFDKSRWNDEVWQIVSVSSKLNNPDRIPSPPGTSRSSTIPSMHYFIHGSGIYLNDLDFDETFYNPLLASYYDPDEKAYYVNNWAQHPHIPSIHKSGLLVTTKYKDVGAGILEVTYILHNAGTDLLDYHNLPWGGVRKSNLPQAYLSTTDNTLELRDEKFGGDNPGILGSIDQSGGYFIWTEEGNLDDRGALGIVFGKDTHYNDLKDKHNMLTTRLRWGDASGDTERNYQVFVLNPRLDIQPGETFFYRLYYINGSKEYVHETSQLMVPFCDYGFINVSPETAPVTRIKTQDFENAFTQDLNLFTAPVKNMVPLYLMENTTTNQKYISPDLYYDVTTEPFDNPYDPDDDKYQTYQYREINKPYDGKIRYLRLLGYGVKKDQVQANVRFALLDTLIANDKLVILPSGFKSKIWVPIELCDDCAQETILDPVSGFVRYNSFDDNQMVEWTEPYTMEFIDNIDNPSVDADNPSKKVGKLIRGEGTWSNIHFNIGDYLNLSENFTFKVKAYYESEDPVPENCEVFLILRDDGPEPPQQYGVRKDVPIRNKWVDYEFVCPGAHQRGPYNQVWLFFSSPDYSNETSGQVFYIDDLIGPPLSIREFDIHAPATGDSIIINFEPTYANLISVSNLLFKIVKSDTQEEIKYTHVTWDEKHIYLHLLEGEPVTDTDTVSLSFISGDVVNSEYKILSKFFDKPVQNYSAIIGKIQLNLNILDAQTDNALTNVTISVNEETFITDNQGQIIIELLPGDYSLSVMKDFYEAIDETVSLSADTMINLVMSRLQAAITFLITDDDSEPLPDVNIKLNQQSEYSDINGQALFNELDLGNLYNYSISKTEYSSFFGSLELLKDTTIEHTLSLQSTNIHLKNSKMPIIVYCNPSANQIHIEAESTLKRLFIYNAYGQLIKAQMVGVSSLSLSTEQFINGWYILRGETDEGTQLKTVFQILR